MLRRDRDATLYNHAALNGGRELTNMTTRGVSFAQTQRLESGRIYSTTRVRLPGVSRAAVRRALVDEPWDWWRGGRVSGWRREPNGTVRFVLWPAWLRSPSRFGIVLNAPIESESNTIVPAQFSISFVGPAQYEITDVPDGVELQSRFDGIKTAGSVRLIPLRIVLALHMLGERGDLPFPFRRGSGFAGLAKRLAP